MQKRSCIVIIYLLLFPYSSYSQPAFTKAEMHLSAYGVESDGFPSIDISIDLINRSSTCRKWFYNPVYKDSSYSLSRATIDSIVFILQQTDWEKIEKNYTYAASDQPSSTISIFTTDKQYMVKDYGLKAKDPLQQLYSIVYRW